MCFINEAEWYASLIEESTETATEKTKCHECWREVLPGQTIHKIYQQEHEECQRCEYGECECGKDADGKERCCQCPKPEFGETFNYQRCHDCERFLDAVEVAEVEAGCSRLESRPPLGGMSEEIKNGDRDDSKKYWKKAMAMFPDMRIYLAFLWRKIWG